MDQLRHTDPRTVRKYIRRAERNKHHAGARSRTLSFALNRLVAGDCYSLATLATARPGESGLLDVETFSIAVMARDQCAVLEQ